MFHASTEQNTDNRISGSPTPLSQQSASPVPSFLTISPTLASTTSADRVPSFIPINHVCGPQLTQAYCDGTFQYLGITTRRTYAGENTPSTPRPCRQRSDRTPPLLRNSHSPVLANGLDRSIAHPLDIIQGLPESDIHENTILAAFSTVNRPQREAVIEATHIICK